MSTTIIYSLPVCVTCERRADAKTCICGNTICKAHSYDGRCMECETEYQAEVYGVALHGVAGTKHLGGS